MEPVVVAAIVGAIGLVLVAVVTALGTIILKRMTVMAEAQAAAVVVAAAAKAAAEARDLKMSQIGETVEVIRVDVDGKLKEILELNRDLRYAQGKDAGRLEEVANAQLALAQNQTTPATVSVEALTKALPDALAVAIPQILPELIGKVAESRATAAKDYPEAPAAPAAEVVAETEDGDTVKLSVDKQTVEAKITKPKELGP